MPFLVGGMVGVPPGVQNENLLARVGLGALSVSETVDESSAERGARGALQQHASQAWNLAFQWRGLKPAARCRRARRWTAAGG